MACDFDQVWLEVLPDSPVRPDREPVKAGVSVGHGGAEKRLEIRVLPGRVTVDVIINSLELIDGAIKELDAVIKCPALEECERFAVRPALETRDLGFRNLDLRLGDIDSVTEGILQ